MGVVEPGTIVFVVDDDREVRQSITELLTMEGYEPRPFPTADAAWTAITISGTQPACIILDLWLTGMSSCEFIRKLRASRQASVPVLVLSGARSAEQIEADVDAVVQKPIEACALIRAIDKLVYAGRRGAVAAPPIGERAPPRRAPRDGRKQPARRAPRG
jgi:DNA-binding response OmpR family regulator